MHSNAWVVPYSRTRERETGVKKEQFAGTVSLRSISNVQFDVIVVDDTTTVCDGQRKVIDTLDEKLAYMNLYPQGDIFF